MKHHRENKGTMTTQTNNKDKENKGKLKQINPCTKKGKTATKKKRNTRGSR